MNLKAGVTGDAQNWAGVIRDGKKAVWACPHHHYNRHNTTMANLSAYECASFVLDAVQGILAAKIGKFEKWMEKARFRSCYEIRAAQRNLNAMRVALDVGRKLRESMAAQGIHFPIEEVLR